MGYRRCVQDEVLKVSISVFITNFSDQAGAKELWNPCKQYGHVVDAFIPDRRSKIGKSFGFIRFIKVFDAERLVNNLCTAWIGSHRLHANIARFQRPTGENSSRNFGHNGEKKKYDKGNNGNFNSDAHVLKGVSHPNGDTTNAPSLVIGDDCVNQEDYSCCLNEKVKEFGSLKVVLADMVNIFESFKIIYQGKTFWVRAKEVPGWSMEFEEQLDEDSEPEDDIFGGVDKPNTDNSEEAFEDENVVPDTIINGKKMLYEYLMHVMASWKGDVIIMGDFNEVSYSNERFGSNFNVKRANAFNLFNIQAGLEEIPLGGCSFTWCHKSGSKMSKLDQFLSSESLLSVCPTLSSITLDRFLLDHRPILLRESTYDYGPSPFRFFKYWAKVDGFEKLIVESWSDTAACGMRQIFKNSKIMLKSELADVELVIDKGNASEEVIYKRLEIVNSINELEKQQAMEIAQKAKMKWAIEGDENSKYYHGILNKKMNNLAIRGVPNKTRYVPVTKFSSQLNSMQRMDMEVNVTIEEIKNAVWDYGIDKSPRQDGFSFDFYRRFWSVIPKDVVAAVKCFFHYGSIPKGYNSSFTALIPKILDAKMVKDFRLISLIGSLYKIIAKILANRLVTVLGDVINEINRLLWRIDRFLTVRIVLNSSMVLSYMFFADDAVFVGQWSNSNIDTIIYALKCFERAFGLRLNMSKSKIMGIAVNGDKVDQVAHRICCGILEVRFTYLGSKVGGCMSRIKNWNDVVENMSSRLSKWKMKTLSIGGTRMKSGYNSLWRDIVFEMEAVKDKGADLISFMQKRLGDGVDTCFWKDTWNGELPFKLTYLRLYALEVDKNISLEDQPEDVQLVNKRDRWAWSLSGSGEFSVASIRRLLDDIRLPEVSSQTRWIKAVPIKVNILAWKVRLNGLPSRVNISRRGIDINSILCPICERVVESVSHVFFSCYAAKDNLKRFVVGGMWISRRCRRMMSGYCGFQALGSTINIKRCWKEFVMVFGGTYGFFETNGCLVTIVLLWRGCLMMSCCVLFIGFDIVVRHEKLQILIANCIPWLILCFCSSWSDDLPLVVIVVTVVILAVILIFVVVAIVGVVIVVAIIGLVVVVVSFTWPGVPIGIVSICHGSSLCFQRCGNTISNQLPNGGLSHGGCCRYNSLKEWPDGGVVNLTGDEDPTGEDRHTGMGDSTGVSMSLGGEISSEGKKYRESNIGGSDNTRDRDNTAGREIIA
nr:RNA-directed DNA polymerase, eukaryota [Tanacetum cinerariifolium]